ncbi:hypothetical protein SynA15127_01707 [Synechococcus sp. A15-127]|nr:hypothetical protein SynA15127_01707 [Synechococcus sp. A15-127]
MIDLTIFASFFIGLSVSSFCVINPLNQRDYTKKENKGKSEHPSKLQIQVDG